MRKDDVARAAGVSPAQVQQVDVAVVQQALADRVASAVLDAATQEPATYWLAGGCYWLDDPHFGDVVNFSDLDYSANIGLYKRRV